MATATKTKTAAQKKEEAAEEAIKELEEQIEVFEPRTSPVKRVLVHPETGDKKEFIQQELGYMAKLRFFRLVSGTLRIAAERDGNSVSDTVSGVIEGNELSVDSFGGSGFLETILYLVELSPDFMENLYVLSLNVKPKDDKWVREAFETLNEDEGLDILELFVEQNGKSIKNFFVKRLRGVGQKIQATIADDPEE